MLLTEKITKESDMPDMGSVLANVRDLEATLVHMPWWLRREYLRIDREVYPEATTAVNSINSLLPQFALHVSKEDPTLVAYTPDRAYGEADRQVRTTLGKFLTKYYPHLDDNLIRKYQEEHLAELDPTFEQLYGEDIVAAYRQLGEQKQGACMSYGEEKYVGGNPTQAYDAPGISMAVLRDSAGRITSRSMLFCPSETDKRYIRIYLNNILRKKLERAGYKIGTWVGAKFKTIELDSGNFVVPYLDGSGTYADTKHSTVALISGQLKCISEKARSRIHNKFGSNYTYLASGTSGATSLRNIEILDDQTCFLTGVKLSWLTDSMYSYWDGENFYEICEEAANNLRQIVIYTGKKAYVAQATPIFSHRQEYYADNLLNRTAQGFVRLDPLIYPEEQEWKSSSQYVKRYVLSCRKTYLKAEETVKVYSKGVWEQEHVSVIDKSYTKLHPLRGRKAYAVAGETILRTVKGSKVVDSGYDIHQTYKGDWDFTRNLRSTSVLGEYFWYSKGEAIDRSFGSPLWMQYFDKRAADKHPKDVAMTYIKDYGSTYDYLEGRQLYRHNLNDVKLANVKGAAWYKNSPEVQFTVRWAEIKLAEMEAIDYSLGPMPTPNYSAGQPYPTVEENYQARLLREDRARLEALVVRTQEYSDRVTEHNATALRFIAAA